MPAKTRAICSGPNGDQWFLGYDADSGRVYVRHVATAPGGETTDFDIDTFLSRWRGRPEHQALVRLIETLAENRDA